MTQKPSTATNDQPNYWRSISELHGSEEFQKDYLHREFPVAASEYPEGLPRRRWMQLMGASLAMAGVSGCRYPEELIAPFVIRPEGRVPGEFYTRATNFELAGSVHNLIVRLFDGRPQHIESNGSHPGGGGTDSYVQASILSLYDPDRSRGDNGPLLFRGESRKQEKTWDDFLPAGRAAIKAAASNGNGKGFAILMSPTSSPTLVRSLDAIKEKLPAARIARFDSVGNDVVRNASKKMLGVESQEVLDLSEAKVIFSLGADFLSGSSPSSLSASQSFAKNRNPLDGEMSRLYMVEGGYSTTGAMADSRMALRPSQMPAFMGALSRMVTTLKGGQEHDHSGKQDELSFNDPDITAEERMSRFMDCLAHDIVDAGDKAVVIVGAGLGQDLVSAGIAMNGELGSLGKLQKFTPCVDGELETSSIKNLIDAMNVGNVETLVILGDNPVIAGPGELDIAAAIDKVDTTFYLGEYDDETAVHCNWSLPLAHPLESWSDCVDAHGLYGVCQPQILPLMGGRTAAEVLALMLNVDVYEPMKLVRATADSVAGKSLSEREWRQLLHDGFSDDIKVGGGEVAVSGKAPELPKEAPVASAPGDFDTDQMEVIFTIADGIYDGRFANNGWLQELPQSITKLTWGNAAVMGPPTAAKLGIEHGEFVTLRKDGQKVELPAFLIPGVAPGVASSSFTPFPGA